MVPEQYLVIHAPEAKNCANAFSLLYEKYLQKLSDKSLSENSAVVLRFFCSDVTRHAPMLQNFWPDNVPCQKIFIGQAPLESTFCSLLAYHIEAPAPLEKKIDAKNNLVLRHGEYTSIWTLSAHDLPGTSAEQTDCIISDCTSTLDAHGAKLEQDVLRTWYYVRDIDNNYSGMVQKRKKQYEALGLRPDTRFIASTGIEGKHVNPHVLVWLHTLGTKGLVPEQISYLKGLTHLSPTHVYGVNFERATKIQFGDRVHCHISGTASIDAAGQIVHEGDVSKQLGRTMENIQVLLQESDMTLDDMQYAIVYLRDPHDKKTIAPLLDSMLPRHCATILVEGAVCRPAWLIEVEGVAIRFRGDSRFPNFL